MFTSICWSCIPLLLEEKLVPVGFGVQSAFRACFVVVWPYLSAGLITGPKSNPDFNKWLWLYFGLNAWNVTLCIILMVRDRRGNKVLQGVD